MILRSLITVTATTCSTRGFRITTPYSSAMTKRESLVMQPSAQRWGNTKEKPPAVTNSIPSTSRQQRSPTPYISLRLPLICSATPQWSIEQVGIGDGIICCPLLVFSKQNERMWCRLPCNDFCVSTPKSNLFISIWTMMRSGVALRREFLQGLEKPTPSLTNLPGSEKT